MATRILKHCKKCGYTLSETTVVNTMYKTSTHATCPDCGSHRMVHNLYTDKRNTMPGADPQANIDAYRDSLEEE